MRLAIITARGGSKRIPKKNIRNFCGRPIIAYSIEAALLSERFDEVMVSTDCTKIAAIAKSYGASVPFIRSKENASDIATTAEVILEVLREYENRNIKPDLACCIYPTAPFTTAKVLQESLHILQSNTEISGVLPIVKYSYPIQRALKLDNGLISLCLPEHQTTRSQDLENNYHDAGQFYWFRVDSFLSSKNLLNPRMYGLIIPESAVQDIDSEEDWKLAELKYQLLKQQELC